MKKQDIRVTHTKQALQDALLRILKTTRIDQVTVKNLCEEAGINRGTFYLHYATPNDVLHEIEHEFMSRQLVLFSTYLGEIPNTNRLQELFRYFLENFELARILVGPNGNPKFSISIKESMRKDVVDSWCKEFPQYKKEHLDYVFDYVFSGSMALIANWINDSSITAEQLANRLDRLGHYAHLAIQEFE